jgi:hypothetical protein
LLDFGISFLLIHFSAILVAITRHQPTPDSTMVSSTQIQTRNTDREATLQQYRPWQLYQSKQTIPRKRRCRKKLVSCRRSARLPRSHRKEIDHRKSSIDNAVSQVNQRSNEHEFPPYIEAHLIHCFMFHSLAQPTAILFRITTLLIIPYGLI